jgi:hypothetical protein
VKAKKTHPINYNIAWVLVLWWFEFKNWAFFRCEGQQNAPPKLNIAWFKSCNGTSSKIEHSWGVNAKRTHPINYYITWFQLAMTHPKIKLSCWIRTWNENPKNYKYNKFLHF